ncbi:(5-formylfuran-3-yl)methyl phosphate synthase [Alienimonas sp. DA493]|uniref:(5-formylfuran-3-yl)methyl phosphate synthase n=1 Tax=Alienimonas sp. DA493 TaxID=3373605 RepID=UPI003754D372
MAQLLVSVRDAAEARAALAGGADVIDVKEPARGSLGRADEAVWDEVAALCAADGDSSRAAVSVALGEAAERPSLLETPLIPAGVRWAKLGLAGLLPPDAPPVRNPQWVWDWLDARFQYEAIAAERRTFQWVAVAYADHAACDAPAPEAVLAEAAPAGCVALLVDTFHKDGRGLFDHLSDERLTELGEQARRRGLTFALAGSLTIEDVPRALACGAEIVAVRGAACDGDRTGRVSEAKVRALKDAVASGGR